MAKKDLFFAQVSQYGLLGINDRADRPRCDMPLLSFKTKTLICQDRLGTKT